VKYCPNLACPHRGRVKAPAEFVDRVSVCSDCGTPLVGSEQEAIEGLQPVVGGPYRGVARPVEAAPRRFGARGSDTVVGAAFLGGGLLLTLFTYATASGGGGGHYVVAWGPMIYGIYRLVRGRPSSGA
jgi:hypothetical protein